ncbi:Uncharacterized protein ACMD2_05511 [Ananas comosus]|uniref:Nucleotide-diphospho-sugar transferase domain-containing protein n=1 Tax=Ananas comosus TaxID=4615 RepID=A0A199WA04_ANACO|nr:Uncharacterized protein ACMD2_05511 [Ananas comosus]
MDHAKFSPRPLPREWNENIDHLLNHLIRVALDQKAFDRCMVVHPYCYFFKLERGCRLVGESFHEPGEYVELVRAKVEVQRRVVELGYNFLFTYVDTDYRGGSCNHGNDLNTVYTMHARCCVGLDWNKIHDLKNLLEDWKNY